MARKIDVSKLEFNYFNDIEENYLMLANWFKNEEVYKYHGGKWINFYDIRDTYSKMVSDRQSKGVFIVYYDGKPIGIFTYELFRPSSIKELYTNFNLGYIVDFILGDIEYRDRMLITFCISTLLKHLNEYYKASYILCEVQKNNKFLIKCLRYAGFVRLLFQDKNMYCYAKEPI